MQSRCPLPAVTEAHLQLALNVLCVLFFLFPELVEFTRLHFGRVDLLQYASKNGPGLLCFFELQAYHMFAKQAHKGKFKS